MARPPAELPREDADDGPRHDERQQDQTDVWPRVAAAAKGRADADGAGGRAPRKAEDEEGGREGPPRRRARPAVTRVTLEARSTSVLSPVIAIGSRGSSGGGHAAMPSRSTSRAEISAPKNIASAPMKKRTARRRLSSPRRGPCS